MSSHTLVIVTREQVDSSDVKIEVRCSDCDLLAAEYPVPVEDYIILQCPAEPPPASGEWLALYPGVMPSEQAMSTAFYEEPEL